MTYRKPKRGNRKKNTANLARIFKAVKRITKQNFSTQAAQLGVSKQNFSYQMSKDVDITLEIIDKLAKLNDIDPVYLFSFIYHPLPRGKRIKPVYIPPLD